MSSTTSSTQLIKIEQAICDSHFNEKLNKKLLLWLKLKVAPIFFVRYAKKNSNV